jgi:HEAT repeat protein
MADLDGKPAEQVLDALKRRNLEGKRALIADLRRKKTDKAVEILIDVLQDDSWYLRELATEALGEAGKEAVPRLREILTGGLWYTRASAARALGKIGDPSVVPALTDLLDDPNQTVQEAALAAFADIVRVGYARKVSAHFWAKGPKRANELTRLFLAAHPEVVEPVLDVFQAPPEQVPAPGEVTLHEPVGETPADEAKPETAAEPAAEDPGDEDKPTA